MSALAGGHRVTMKNVEPELSPRSLPDRGWLDVAACRSLKQNTFVENAPAALTGRVRQIMRLMSEGL